MELFSFLEEAPRFLDKHEEREGFTSYYFEFGAGEKTFRNLMLVPKTARVGLNFRFYEKKHGIWFELNEPEKEQTEPWFESLVKQTNAKLAERDRVRRLFLKKKAPAPRAFPIVHSSDT